jgi:hypothetical protein
MNVGSLKELDANRLGNQKHFTVQKSPDRLIYRWLSAHMIVWMLHARLQMQFILALHTRIPGPQTARSGGWDLEVVLVLFVGDHVK